VTIGNIIARTASRLPWMWRRAGKLSQRNALLRLKALGFTPTTIYDIGAYRGGWSRLAVEIFPTASFVLFEANADNAAYLKAFGHRHFIVALDGADAIKTFFVPRCGDATGASLYLENTSHYADENLIARKIATSRLDALVETNGLPPPNLVKIDVQGAEMDVIMGATHTIDCCDALIAELSLASYNRGAPLMADIMSLITQRGFRCIDICELHRTAAGGVLQIDFLFVKPDLFDKSCAQMGLR
jgi:FkbM family methyltransferase